MQSRSPVCRRRWRRCSPGGEGEIGESCELDDAFAWLAKGIGSNTKEARRTPSATELCWIVGAGNRLGRREQSSKQRCVTASPRAMSPVVRSLLPLQDRSVARRGPQTWLRVKIAQSTTPLAYAGRAATRNRCTFDSSAQLSNKRLNHANVSSCRCTPRRYNVRRPPVRRSLRRRNSPARSSAHRTTCQFCPSSLTAPASDSVP